MWNRTRRVGTAQWLTCSLRVASLFPADAMLLRRELVVPHMEGQRKSPATVRFGPFEADVHGGVLYRSGSRIKLQKQPFQILAALLERPGEVITRDELRHRIWPADTFVDFERGLNKAIRRIREGLGDSADTPKYVETVTGRGYRFVAAVERKVLSLAVLPFENLSGDPHQEYWADGITDELITSVARIVNLRVISRSSAMRFKSTTKSLAEIARDLCVDIVLQGSIVVSERRLRIRTQLVDPFKDEHLWAETNECELGDVITLQTLIAQQIASHVRAELRPEEPAHSQTRRGVDANAYEAYLKGRLFLGKGTGVDKSLEYFKRAIALDPDYAAPQAGLADCYILLGVLYLRPPHEVFPRAKEFAKSALKRDEANAEAHKSLGTIRNLYDWDWQGAEDEFRRALELDPNLAGAHQGYAILLSCLRRYEEAREEINKARALDPLSVSMNALVGFVYVRSGQYDRALDACHHAIELDGNSPFAHWLLARSLDAAGQTGEALAESEMAAKLSGYRSPYTGHLGYALARTRDRTGASAVLHDLSERQKTEYVSPYEFAQIYTALGEHDAAFEWLEKAYRERAPRLPGELWGRQFDAIRSHERFQNLIRRTGLPC
jgi:TolB-like protein/tetratricopeptide (TPR) repeat protein